jgi:DNA-binding PadR family transcriptional regulator
MRSDPNDFLPLGTEPLYILLALASRPLHGYGIIRDVDERSEGEIRLQSGALYRALRHMLRDGLIEETPAPADEPNDDERRRYYRPTAFGRRVLEAEVARMARLVRAARHATSGKRPRLA